MKSVNEPQPTPFTVYTNTEQLLEPGGEPGDREMATRALKALHYLQEAIDSCALAGLIVEPAFKRYPNRFKDRGSDMESYVGMVEIYRKLA